MADELPVAVDGLAKWTIGDRMLAAALAAATGGDDLEDRIAAIVSAELRRGTLPPGQTGADIVADIASAAQCHRAGGRPRHRRARTRHRGRDLCGGPLPPRRARWPMSSTAGS